MLGMLFNLGISLNSKIKRELSKVADIADPKSRGLRRNNRAAVGMLRAYAMMAIAKREVSYFQRMGM